MPDEHDSQLDQIAEEIAAECRAGRRPDLERYCQRYPHLAADIADLFPALIRLEQARPTGRTELNAAFPLPCAGAGPLGDYRIVREIGRGGMGIVYEAVQESLRRPVALKVLSPWRVSDHRHAERFEREARAAARLHHTNIVPVLGVGEHQHLHYLVMQLIDGFALDEVVAAILRVSGERAIQARDLPSCTLSDIATGLLSGSFPVGVESRQAPQSRTTIGPASDLSASERAKIAPQVSAPREGPQDFRVRPASSLNSSRSPYWQSVARVGLQAADALAYAANQGVVHRDIKPSNLLLDAQGTLWVADFGLAKMADSAELTMTGELIGTLRYLPPERLHGESDARGDIYGLGATLYELVCLRPPFAEDEQAVLLRRIVETEPVSPRSINPAIPRDLETIIVKAMAKNPADRYANPEEFAGDLRSFLYDLPISARRTGPAERFWRWCRRHPAVAIPTAAAATLAIVIVVGAIMATARLSHENQLARDSEHRAVAAENARREELFRAHVTNARRSSVTGRLGQRLDGLKAIQAALSSLPAGELTTERRFDVIDAAIPCLTRADAREVFRVPGKPVKMRAVAVDAAFQRFAYALPEDRGTIVEQLFGRSSRQEFPGIPEEHSTLANWRTFSRSGKWLSEVVHRSSENASQRVRVWNCQSQQLALDWLPKPSGCEPEFHPDERHILIAAGDGAMRLFDLTTGDLVRESPARFSAPIPRFSNDGKLLAVGSIGSDPLIIDPSTWETVANLPDVGPARSLAWGPHDDYLIVGSLAGRIYRWDRATGRGCFLPGRDDSAIQEVRISGDAKWLASSTGATTQLRRLDGDLVHLQVPGSTPAFSPDGRRLAIVSQDQVCIHELIPAPSYSRIGSTADAAQFSSDGRWLIASGRIGAQIYTADDLKLVGDLELDHSGPVGFQRNGQGMLTFGTFAHVWRWPFEGTRDLRLGTPQPVIPSAFRPPTVAVGGLQPQHQGRHAVFTEDDRSVVLADYRNDRVLVVDLASGTVRKLATLPSVTRVAVSPEGKWIAGAAAISKRVNVWNATDGQLALDLPEHCSVAFRDDGRRLAVRSLTEIEFYDTETWKRTRTISELEAPAQVDAPIAFQPGGSLLAVADSARRVHLFDSDTGKLVLNLTHQDPGFMTWLSFSPDGARLAVTRSGHDIVVWDLCCLQQELLELGLSANRFAPARRAQTSTPPETLQVARGSLPGQSEWHLYWKSLALSEARKQLWPDAVHAATNSLAQIQGSDSLARAELLTMRGEYRYRNHNWLGARDDWEAAIAFTPTATKAARSLARLHLMGPTNARDPRRVGPLIALLEQENEGSEETDLLRAIANIRLGRFNAEDVALLEGLNKESDYSPIATHLAALGWHGLGDHKRAAEAFAKGERLCADRDAPLDEIHSVELDGLRAEVLPRQQSYSPLLR